MIAHIVIARASPAVAQLAAKSSMILGPTQLRTQMCGRSSLTARSKAREERLAANRAMSCNQCLGQQPSLLVSQIPPRFQHGRCCVQDYIGGPRAQLASTEGHTERRILVRSMR